MCLGGRGEDLHDEWFRERLSCCPGSGPITFITTRNKPARQRMTFPLRNTLTTHTQPEYLHHLLDPIYWKIPKTIKGAFSVAHTTRYSVSPTETQATILVSLYNLNGNPTLLFKVRGKLRVHSGQVGWVSSRWSIFTHDGQISQAERSTRPTNRFSMPR